MAKSVRKGNGGKENPEHEEDQVLVDDNGRWWGEAGSCLYPLSVKFSRKVDNTGILEVYHAWFRTDRPDDLNVIDCKDISVKIEVFREKVVLRQVPKSRDNN